MLHILVTTLILGAPEQIHLAWKNEEVMWATWLDNSTDGTPGKLMLDDMALDTVYLPMTYQFQSASKEPVYTSPDIFHGQLTNLTCGGQVHTYKVGGNPTWSDEYTFTTLPCLGPDVPFSFALMGDLGQTVNSSMTVDHVYDGMTQSQDPLQMAWLVGDLSYADASSGASCGYPDACNPARWDSWGRMVQKITARMPLMTGAGNHEMENSPPPVIGVEFLEYNSRMKAADGGNAPFWYSMSVGPVHMITLNSYMNYSVDSPQYKWLVNDLRMVDRSVTPWLFVGLHAPWYNSNKHHQNEPEENGMRLAMEPLLHQYAVDILFAGHVHAYERSQGVYNKSVLPGAMIEINIGDGGNREVLEADPADWLSPQPDWSVFRQNTYGHGRVQIFNSTHMMWSWHTIKTPENVTSDSVWLVHNTSPNRGVHAL
ncbi:Purple acid phosphatase 18 [Diplonema papillatum]|nr:Purple acid phosphatase 18 [Diplonema papillatum]